jgi:hypothetical protein
MTVYELVEMLNGEIVRGQARIRQGRDYVILGRLNGNNMEFTEEGRVLSENMTPKQEEVPKRGRKAKEVAEPVVEDVSIDDDFTVSIDKE